MSEVKFSELFDSRNKHEVRLALVEDAVPRIEASVEKIGEQIDTFIKETNGVPRRNKLEILKHETRIKVIEDAKLKEKGYFEGASTATKVSWAIIVSLIGAVIYLLRLALANSM